MSREGQALWNAWLHDVKKQKQKVGEPTVLLFIAEQVTESVPERPGVDKGPNSRALCTKLYPWKMLKKEMRFLRKKACVAPWPYCQPLPP